MSRDDLPMNDSVMWIAIQTSARGGGGGDHHQVGVKEDCGGQEITKGDT